MHALHHATICLLSFMADSTLALSTALTHHYTAEACKRDTQSLTAMQATEYLNTQYAALPRAEQLKWSRM